MAESELPEEIPVDLLLASRLFHETNPTFKEPETPKELAIQRQGEDAIIEEKLLPTYKALAQPAAQKGHRSISEIDPQDHSSEGHFIGHGERSNQGMAVTSQGKIVVGPSRVWYAKPKDVSVEESVPEKMPSKTVPAVNNNGQSELAVRQAPRMIPVTPKNLRQIAGNLIMDYLLADQNGGEMNLPQAVMLTAKQSPGSMLSIPVGSSELYRINPEDWVGIEELLQSLRFSLLPSEEGVLFRPQVEVHPDFAAMMVLQGL
jgi:hypothetical protein